MNETEKIILNIISEQVMNEYKQEQVTVYTRLDELGLDSLDIVEVLAAIEDKFDITIDDDIEFKTFGDLCQQTLQLL